MFIYYKFSLLSRTICALLSQKDCASKEFVSRTPRGAPPSPRKKRGMRPKPTVFCHWSIALGDD
jgi:hypothetical protein